MSAIYGFFGEYRWLSNFWPSIVILDGQKYPTAENAYQAAKTLDIEARKPLITSTARWAKGYGRTLCIRPAWDIVKVAVMEALLIQKFSEPSLRKRLLNTDECYIEETNRWGDTFWGVCRGEGKNQLGLLLMKVRESIRTVDEASSI